MEMTFVQERRGLSLEMMQQPSRSIADRARLSTRTNGTVPLHIKHARVITETLRPVEVMQNDDDDSFARLLPSAKSVKSGQYEENRHLLRTVDKKRNLLSASVFATSKLINHVT